MHFLFPAYIAMGGRMAKLTFKKTELDKLPFCLSGQKIYWDTATAGLGIVVGKRAKTFIYQMDVKDPSRSKGYRTVKKTLGRYGLDLTIEQARDAIKGYVDSDGAMVMGKRLEIKQGPAQSKGKNVTLREMMSMYFTEKNRKDGKARKESTVTGYTTRIKRQYAAWLNLTLADIAKLSPDIIIDNYKRIEANSGPMEARNSSVMLGAILQYACTKYPAALPYNPIRVLSRTDGLMQQVQPRKECLLYDANNKRNDFHTFYDGLKKFPDVAQDCYLFILYTGMRSMEGAGLRWEHVDMDSAEMLIPDTKNREALHVPLSRQAVKILKRRKEQVEEGVPWVFPAIRGNICKLGHIRIQAARLKEETGLDITIHALRRTFITVGRKLKRFEDTDRLTNHIDSSVSGRHYDETDINDLRETAQMIGNEIERRLTEQSAKVIQFPGAQAA